MSSRIGDRAVQLARTEQTHAAVSRSRRRLFGRLLVWASLCGGALLMVIPFIWMVSTSLKVESQIWLIPPKWIPEPIRWEN